MDTKDDKPQQREPAWLTYPDVKTIRANPIPRQDSSWINEFRDRRDKDIGYEDANGKKAERATHPHLHMTLCSKPMQLKDSDRFPGFAVFNAARALFEKKGADVLAHLDPLDKKLLGNFEGYELMDTDAKWYLANCLRCKRRWILDIFEFSDVQYPCALRWRQGIRARRQDHLHPQWALCQFAAASTARHCKRPQARHSSQDRDRAPEGVHAHHPADQHACPLHHQWPCPPSKARARFEFRFRALIFLCLKGDKYEESEPPYLFGIFPQRDMHCRPDFETKIVRALDYATLDMPEFAKVTVQCLKSMSINSTLNRDRRWPSSRGSWPSGSVASPTAASTPGLRRSSSRPTSMSTGGRTFGR